MASIRQRIARDGAASWAVLFRDSTGKQTSITFRDPAAAELFRQRLDAAGLEAALRWHAAYAPDETGKTPPTVADLAEAYLAWKASRVRSDRTIADYRRDIANHILPTFGQIPAAEVTDADVQDWIDGMIGELSPKTIAGYHALLSAMFRWGSTTRAGKLVPTNPCLYTDLPRRTKQPAKGLRRAEWLILHAAAAEVCPDAADMLLFMVGTGWRWSEATAFQVSQVTDDGDRLMVDMDAVVRRTASGQYVRVSDAKSAAGTRSVRLSLEVAQMVRRRVRGKAGSDRVFTSPSGAAWHQNNFRNRQWNRIIERAGELGLTRRPTVHWLRHTHAGLLLGDGTASMPGVQRRLGHASITTTVDTYGRMVDDVSPEALDALDRLLVDRPKLRVVVDEGA